MSLNDSINHVAKTVSDLDQAMKFFGPMLKLLGYTVGTPSAYKEHRLTVSLNQANGIAFNIWEAERPHAFEVCEPRLHHIAFNVTPRSRVDRAAQLVRDLGGEIVDGPSEFPFTHCGYYTVYFLGPDRIKFEIVYMPELERDRG